MIAIDAHKMPQNRHFGTGFDIMQQEHGAAVKNNKYLHIFLYTMWEWLHTQKYCVILRF